MARIESINGEDAPVIDEGRVRQFFDDRAKKFDDLGPLRTVIYQDKNPELAIARDAAEKERLLPLLALDGRQRVLDVGCGVGRWADLLAGNCEHYHGIDAAGGLIDHARRLHADKSNCRFSVLRSDELSLETLDEAPFDAILCAGLLIYLNDDVMLATLQRFAEVAAPRARIVLREPIGLTRRLTLKDHYSDEMAQDYHAIYRTPAELADAFSSALLPAGFRQTSEGDVYLDPAMNNRAETRQLWFLLERET